MDVKVQFREAIVVSTPTKAKPSCCDMYPEEACPHL